MQDSVYKAYLELLLLWNQKINLVSRETLDDPLRRHFYDSQQLKPFLLPGSVLDLGSGAGFPGAVLSFMGVQDITLLESCKKKCYFLREVKRALKGTYQVFEGRIESYPKKGVDTIVSRALAPLDVLLDYGSFLLAPHGRCVFLKGASWEAEVSQASKTWDFQWQSYPSQTHEEGKILVVEKILKK